MMNSFDLSMFNDRIIGCRRCPRLVEWREQIADEKRRAFSDWEYWGKPVPAFGDPLAKHLIVGLAPAAHGANRTGRMFTGDKSGEWLYRALHRAGVANQPEAHSKQDGLILTGVLIVATAHCAPPDNRPTPDEIQNCSSFLREVLDSREWTGILCLGGIAWNHIQRMLEHPKTKFGHGASFIAKSGPAVVGSYHPSQQNTFTGRLTERMLDDVIHLWLHGPRSSSINDLLGIDESPARE